MKEMAKLLGKYNEILEDVTVTYKDKYSPTEITAAMIHSQSEAMQSISETRGVCTETLHNIIEKTFNYVIDLIDEELEDDSIKPVVLTAVTSKINRAVTDSLFLSKNECDGCENCDCGSNKSKEENVKRICAVYKDKKLNDADLATMVEQNTITLGDIAENLGMDIANEVLKIASNRLKSKEPNKDKEQVKAKLIPIKELDNVMDIIKRKNTMSFEDFSKEMNGLSDETKKFITSVVKDMMMQGDNVKVIRVPVGSSNPIPIAIESMLKEIAKEA